jgi:phosphopantothenoylcysteine decarboxylase/phosphopantothenate--cysteine ligase
VSTGGTREPIDPVRFSATAPAGQGASALAAADRGAEVVLGGARRRRVLDAVPPHAHHDVRVGTAAELQAAMTDAAAAADVVAMVAAVADYRVAEVSREKLRKEDGVPRLELVTTPMCSRARRAPPGQTSSASPPRRPPTTRSCSRGAPQAGAQGRRPAGGEPGRRGPRLRGADNRVLPLDAPTGRVGCRGHKREVADAIWDAVAAIR